MKIAILPSAREDLGSYFLESLYGDIESLQLYAGIHLRVFGYYRLLSKRFPYAVYYDLEDRTIRIWAVLDCRQEPATMRHRLAGLHP
jgi:plasmid stabilization system protein ParE